MQNISRHLIFISSMFYVGRDITNILDEGEILVA